MLRLVLRGLAHQALIAMCKSEGETPNEWLKKSVCAEIVEFFDFNLNGQHFPQMLERDVEV